MGFDTLGFDKLNSGVVSTSSSGERGDILNRR